MCCPVPVVIDKLSPHRATAQYALQTDSPLTHSEISDGRRQTGERGVRCVLIVLLSVQCMLFCRTSVSRDHARSFREVNHFRCQQESLYMCTITESTIFLHSPTSGPYCLDVRVGERIKRRLAPCPTYYYCCLLLRHSIPSHRSHAHTESSTPRLRRNFCMEIVRLVVAWGMYYVNTHTGGQAVREEIDRVIFFLPGTLNTAVHYRTIDKKYHSK